jgi:predicted MFS family arabinose efflux permease
VISGLLSWRLTFILLAGLCLVFVALLFRKLPHDSGRVASEPGGGLGSVTSVLRDSSISMAMFSNYLSTSYWFVFVTYMGAYFHDEFGLAKWSLGGLTMVSGNRGPGREQRGRAAGRPVREAARDPVVVVAVGGLHGADHDAGAVASGGGRLPAALRRGGRSAVR